ncbi:PREDICTED: neurturin [Rhinopithecus bieti]|uniref:neurturin n=1 Tax=Rhinopithecus bieti TaxID=61621 RepID=UPI00083BDC81|nr:PREDICTED: neurturin [Rhinopithecus bieti]
MQRWKAAALASVLCSSVLSIWMCREGLLLSHRLGPALVPLRRLPRTLDTRIARLAQYRALLQGAPDAVELRELTPWAGRPPGPRRRAGPRRRPKPVGGLLGKQFQGCRWLGSPPTPAIFRLLRFEVVDSSTIWADSAWPPQRGRSFQTLRKPK